MWRSSYAICNFPCINVHKRPDDGSPLQPKHVAVNKLVKLVFCDMKHNVLLLLTLPLAEELLSELRNKLFSHIYYWHITI